MGFGGKAQDGEFLPGITIPREIHGLLRQRISEIAICDSAINCLVAQARAESLVEALKVLKILPAEAIERLNILIEDTATVRVSELGRPS